MRAPTQPLVDAFRTNRKKASELEEGAEALTFHPEKDGREVLWMGTVVRCDECPSVSLMNAGRVLASSPIEPLLTLPFCRSSRMLPPDSIGCYDTDGSGDVLCPACSALRSSKTAVQS